MIRHRLWIGLVACAAIATILLCRFYLSKSRPDGKAVTAAEDEVYEAVVRDMVTPSHGQATINQLVFDETVLNGLTTGADIEACKENAREQVLRWKNDTPPYNSLVDKIYRAFTRGRDDGWLRDDTIQDFLNKSCTEGPLSRTFRTEFPRVFIDSGSVFFDIVPFHRNGLTDFRETFPGASGIISLSHVGFDSTLHQAIVSTSFVCGGLCGTGQLYILKKKRGKWEVAANSILWVS
jgi:hypothetical protein